MGDLTQFAETNIAARIREAAARGTLSHALIFSGAGERVDAARYAAAAMECTAAEKPCLRCAHCRKVMADVHPDVLFVRDSEHKELSVERVREVRTDAFIRPNEGARKVYLFEDCAVLNEKDQNVLLKVVEEGPPYAAFLFCAENPSVLLQTIRSRCVELKTAPAAGQSGDGDREQALALCRALLGRSAADRAAYLLSLERARGKEKLTREALGSLLAQARELFARALLAHYAPEGADEAERALARALDERMSRAQQLGAVELLEKYRASCEYNVNVGAVLGGLAAEWEKFV